MDASETSNIEPELLSLRSKLAADIDIDAKEIEFRKKRMAKNEALLVAVKGALSLYTHNDSNSESSSNGSKAEAIRSAVARVLTAKFTIKDVEQELQAEDPNHGVLKASLRTALWTMAEKGEIRLVKKGTNTSPAEYEKINGVVRFKRTSSNSEDQPEMVMSARLREG